MRRLLGILALLVLLALLGPGCGEPPPPPKPLDLRLFFTAQTHGRLTPCGCFTGQYGGISRLQSALTHLAEPSAHLLGFDAGDALEGLEDYHRIRHRHLAATYATLGYVALNAGRMEATLPAPTLRQLAKDSAVPLIGANLVDRTTGSPILPPSVLVERDGFRIAVVGVLDPRDMGDGPGEGLAVERMETCLARVLPELKKASDAIVLLAHADEAAMASLASEFYEISVILGGRVRQPAQAPMHRNRSVIYFTGNEGKSFGVLQFDALRASGLSLRMNDMILLTDKIPEHPDVLARAADYRRDVRLARLAIDDPNHVQAHQVPGTRLVQGFAGTASCLSCHTNAARVWQGSAHAHAFDSLARRDSDADPACIACHTVGFGQPTGYRREYGKERLVDVGCESCHGPGALHVAQRQPGGTPTFRFRTLDANDCRKCHHGEFSRPFDWDRFWPPVRH